MYSLSTSQFQMLMASTASRTEMETLSWSWKSFISIFLGSFVNSSPVLSWSNQSSKVKLIFWTCQGHPWDGTSFLVSHFHSTSTWTDINLTSVKHSLIVPCSFIFLWCLEFLFHPFICFITKSSAGVREYGFSYPQIQLVV